MAGGANDAPVSDVVFNGGGGPGGGVKGGRKERCCGVVCCGVVRCGVVDRVGVLVTVLCCGLCNKSNCF